MKKLAFVAALAVVFLLTEYEQGKCQSATTCATYHRAVRFI
jgi:hypothetical protein